MNEQDYQRGVEIIKAVFYVGVFVLCLFGANAIWIKYLVDNPPIALDSTAWRCTSDYNGECTRYDNASIED